MFLTELFESIFLSDRMTAFKAIQRHPRAFTHFSNGISGREDQRAPASPKLGINPQKQHGDPYGIYFYYNRWLLDDENIGDSQFATESAHYWICDITRTANSLDLGTLTSAQAAKIATRNGWLDALNDCLDQGKLKMGSIDERSHKRLGAKFWGAMDHLVNEAKSHQWSQLLRGVDAIFDPGYGIINANEPAQVIVFDRKLIRLLEHGDNKNQSSSIFFDGMRQLQAKVGGKLSFRDKRAILDAHIGEAPVQIVVDEFGNVWTSYFKDGFWFTEYEKEGFQARGADSWVEGLLSRFKRLQSKNLGTGGVSRWSRDSVLDFFVRATGREFWFRHESVQDGKLTISTGLDSWGSIYFRAEIEYDQEGNTTVILEIGPVDYDFIKIHETYGPNVSEEAMVADVRAKAKAGIDRTVADGKIKDRDALTRYLKMNL